MDSMVVKYLGLAAITYGTHAFLALGQIALCLFFTINGLLLLSSSSQPGNLAAGLGLIVTEEVRQKRWPGWLMLITGVCFILPLFGMSYWFAVLACPVAIYLLIMLMAEPGTRYRRKSGNFARKALALCAGFVLCFTIWEARDLVRAGWDVNYKAIYWRHKEVSVWQKENNPNVPKVGELAPDFELSDVTGTKSVRLADFRDKRPVVLLFGSFT